MKAGKQIITAMCLAAAAFSQTQTGEVTLRRQLKENAVERYKFEMTSNQMVDMGGGQMPVDMSSAAEYQLKTLTIDQQKKESKIELKVSNLKFEFGGMGGTMPDLPKEIAMNGTMDERNRIKLEPPKGQNGGAALGMMNMMSNGLGDATAGFGIEFPEKRIKIGDSWDVPLPKTPFIGDVQAKLVGKLIGTKKVGSEDAFEISVTGAFPVKIDGKAVTSMMGGDAGALGEIPDITGTVDLSGTVFVSQKTGATLEMRCKIKSTNKFTMASQGTTFNTTGTTTISLIRQ